MSDQEKNFVALCLAGEVDASEIDDFVERWHGSDSELPLSDFLGFNDEEYNVWMLDPNYLRAILFARRHGQPLGVSLKRMDSMAAAARAKSVDDQTLREITEWLATRGCA